MAHSKMPDALGQYQTERTKRNCALVRQAIAEISAAGEQVSFRGVALRSGIGKSTLYRNPILREMIEGARANNCTQPSLEDMQRSLWRLDSEVKMLRDSSRGSFQVVYETISLV